MVDALLITKQLEDVCNHRHVEGDVYVSFMEGVFSVSALVDFKVRAPKHELLSQSRLQGCYFLKRHKESDPFFLG